MIEAELFVALASLHQSCSGWNYKVPYSMPNLRKKRSRVSAITLKTRKVKRQPHVLVISADPKKKKAACHAIASYNASPEKKRAASRASYRADPEEKRAASRVASRASGLPPCVPLFKAYL